jgi:CheY-like chemotaxis protein
VKTPGKYAWFSVTDEGIGMDSETIKHIFDPFYTTKKVGKGTGMGLSVVHGIVESHSGFITVSSKPGKGSTFSVYIPVTGEEEGESLETETATLSLKGTEGILLVDDEEALLELTRRMLERLGYEVVAECSSQKALEIFKTKPDQFDLVLTDQSMPNMSGIEVIAEILKIRPDMPCILCTGFSSKISEANAGKKGIRKYLKKPYDKKILSEAVREVLDNKV